MRSISSHRVGTGPRSGAHRPIGTQNAPHASPSAPSGCFQPQGPHRRSTTASYRGTLDAHVVATHQKTARNWSRRSSSGRRFSMNGATQIANEDIITASSGAESPRGGHRRTRSGDRKLRGALTPYRSGEKGHILAGRDASCAAGLDWLTAVRSRLDLRNGAPARRPGTRRSPREISHRAVLASPAEDGRDSLPFPFFPNEAYDLDAQLGNDHRRQSRQRVKRKVTMQLTRAGFL